MKKAIVKKDSSRELALSAADLAADGKALDIVILDLRGLSSVADDFVLATGKSHIQVEAICGRILEGLRDRLDVRPIAVEGLEHSQWALLDYGGVVVHVFQESIREIYDLERLWSLAPRWQHEDSKTVAAAQKPTEKRGRSASA